MGHLTPGRVVRAALSSGVLAVALAATAQGDVELNVIPHGPGELGASG